MRWGDWFTQGAVVEVSVFARRLDIWVSSGCSGIGPADHLKPLDIPVVKDLPVGENLASTLTRNSPCPSFLITINSKITLGCFYSTLHL